MCYFNVTSFEVLFDLKSKEEYWLIDFEENNDIPNSYDPSEFESKAFINCGSKFLRSEILLCMQMY